MKDDSIKGLWDRMKQYTANDKVVIITAKAPLVPKFEEPAHRLFIVDYLGMIK